MIIIISVLKFQPLNPKIKIKNTMLKIPKFQKYSVLIFVHHEEFLEKSSINEYIYLENYLLELIQYLKGKKVKSKSGYII